MNFRCCLKTIKFRECNFEQKNIRVSLRLAFFYLMYEFLKLSSNINFGVRTAIFQFYGGRSWTFKQGFKKNHCKLGFCFCGFIVKKKCFSHFQISFLFSVCTRTVGVLICLEIFSVKLHVQTNIFLAVDGSGNEAILPWFIRNRTFLCATAQNSCTISKIKCSFCTK